MTRSIAIAACLAVWMAPASSLAKTLRVGAGGSIAAAIDKAEPGDVVEVEPGVYREALTVDVQGLALRGIVRDGQRPVLDGGGELGDGVIASGSPFTMTGFEIRHYKGNGVTTQGVTGVFLSDLVIDDTGLYGVYPVQSHNVTVTHCTVTRIRDAAIYVGESRTAFVAYNEVHHNVAGIEIENTNDAEVRDNLVYENTAGILAFVLPGKMLKEGKRTLIHRNWVVRNNTENFGDPESIVGALPHGLGIVVTGADGTRIENNQVKDNGSMGIGIVRLADEQAAKDPELEPFSDGTRVGFNHLSGNGTAPHPSIQKDYGGGGDLGWDGTGTGNCADLPDAAIRRGAALPACPAESAPSARREPAASGASQASQAGKGALTPAPTPGAALPDDASAVVRIRAMRFEPKHLTVARGAKVAWVNDDAVAHTVTSGAGTVPSGAPLASPFLGRNAVYAYAFEEPGRYEYLCLPHMDQAPMREATVTVLD